MAAGNNGTEMLPAAEQLAKALRSGLELRWSIPKPPADDPDAFPRRGNVRSFLEPYADALNYRLSHSANPLRRFIRLVRFLTQKLIRPWLDFQTHFNFAATNVVDRVEQRVRALEDANLALRQTVETLEKTLLERTDSEMGRQINTLEEGFRLRVNRELSGHGKIGQAGLWFDRAVQVQLDRDGPRITGVSERILERIFVHTHLPHPPARMLVLGCSRCTNAIEMASLGFQVVGVDSRPSPLSHPNFTMIQTHRTELPFEDESFDGCVALSTFGHFGEDASSPEASAACDELAVAEVRRVLKRGGRFLVTLPFGSRNTTAGTHRYDRAGLDRLFHDFRIVERGYGVRDGDSWLFTPGSQLALQSDSGDRVSAVCLLVLEKP